MSTETKIEWATATFNPWEGCTKVSPGCANCYAAVRNHRFGNDNWGKGKPRRRTSLATWRNPVKWQREAARSWRSQDGRYFEERPRVFPSLCDWLDDEVPIEWLADFLKLIHDTPNLDWLLLTKRPENFGPLFDTLRRLSWTPNRDWIDRWHNGDIPHNVWVGASVEDQPRSDERIPQVLEIPAKLRFLSVEPLLDDVKLHLPGIDWVIVGGESGPRARPCNIEWIRSVIRQCETAAVPCFVKQVGSNAIRRGCPTSLTADLLIFKHPKGGDPAEWPPDLRVREFPAVNRPPLQATNFGPRRNT